METTIDDLGFSASARDRMSSQLSLGSRFSNALRQRMDDDKLTFGVWPSGMTTCLQERFDTSPSADADWGRAIHAIPLDPREALARWACLEDTAASPAILVLDDPTLTSAVAVGAPPGSLVAVVDENVLIGMPLTKAVLNDVVALARMGSEPVCMAVVLESTANVISAMSGGSLDSANMGHLVRAARWIVDCAAYDGDGLLLAKIGG